MLRGVIFPGHGDHVLRQCLDQVGAVLRDVAPEEEPLPHRSQRLFDLLQEAEIDRAEPLGTNAIRSLTAAKLERLVGADMYEASRKERVDLGEHLANELHRRGLPGSEDVAMRRLRQRRVELVLE